MMAKAKDKFSSEMYNLLHQFEDTSNALFHREKEVEYLKFKLKNQEVELVEYRGIVARLIAQKFNDDHEYAMANRRFLTGNNPRVLKFLTDMWNTEPYERVEAEPLLK